jgi:hypothetical protein
MMFANIAIQSIIIKIKLPNKEWKLKNTIDHSKFKTNCTPNIKSANLTSFLLKPSRQTKNKDIPIKIYNVVHTGPNNQFGGAHDGLESETYQVEISEIVIIDPMYPIINGINMDIKNLGTVLNL